MDSTVEKVPQFLARLGISTGQWLMTSKLTVRALMRPNWPLKARVWACLVLQAHGYQRDLAVAQYRKLGKSHIAPITPQGIASMLNTATVEAFHESKLELTDELKKTIRVTKQHLRRVLVELEDDGLVVRTRVNTTWEKLQGKTLTECIAGSAVTPIADLSEADQKRIYQRVAIFLLAKPRPAKSLEVEKVAKNGYLFAAKLLDPQADHRAVQLCFDLIPGWRFAPQFAVQAIRLPAVKRAFAAYELARKEARHLEESARAQCINALAQAVGQDAVKAGIGTQEELFQKSPPPAKPTGPEIATVVVAMEHAGAADDEAAAQLIAACRRQDPRASAVMIADAVATKVLVAKRKHNPIGFLIVAVPKLFVGATGATTKREAAEREAARKPKPIACHKCSDSGLLGNPDVRELPAGEIAVMYGAGQVKFCDCAEGKQSANLYGGLWQDQQRAARKASA